MFTLSLGVSTALGVLLPGGSVVWDVALAKPVKGVSTYIAVPEIAS